MLFEAFRRKLALRKYRNAAKATTLLQYNQGVKGTLSTLEAWLLVQVEQRLDKARRKCMLLGISAQRRQREAELARAMAHKIIARHYVHK